LAVSNGLNYRHTQNRTKPHLRQDDKMSLKRILRKVFLALLLGGRSLFGISMSSEKIEELLFSMNQPRAEEVISEEEEHKDQSK
jgi:hypothetical protein